MTVFEFLMIGFIDSLAAHFLLLIFLLVVTDEQNVWKRLKKLPLLLLSVLAAPVQMLLLSFVLPHPFRYLAASVLVFLMCTLWVKRAWGMDTWRAFSNVCMAGILQVGVPALGRILYNWLTEIFGTGLEDMAVILPVTAMAAILLKRSHFGTWFQLLLEDQAGLRRTALLLFVMESCVEAFFILQRGIRTQYLTLYYILMLALVSVLAVLIVYLARRFDDSRMLRFQQDIIAQQQLYEQNLEDIRQEVRSFRHDYKNILAGLSGQAQAGELDALHLALSELDADFDRHLGEKIQMSVQIGNLRILQVRSLLLCKIAAMQEKGIECRLEVFSPVETTGGMHVWDFVRCLGILVDNAMEAALEASYQLQPWVEIVLLAQEKDVFLRVSNPYVNTLAPADMWQEGWSTKGRGRGLGLSSYQRILENYPNAVCSTAWENGVFVQELTVEGRK